MSTSTTCCQSCGSVVAAYEYFCEECGAELTPTQTAPPRDLDAAPISLSTTAAAPPSPPPDPDASLEPTCPVCTSPVVEGYCTRCGAPEAKLRDHFRERPAAWLAGVSDRGVRHHRNEDSLALAADPVPTSFGVLVVCDGVSSSVDSDKASLAAARAARDLLAADRPSGMRSTDARAALGVRLMQEAVEAATDAATGVAPGMDTDPESDTGTPEATDDVGAAPDDAPGDTDAAEDPASLVEPSEDPPTSEPEPAAASLNAPACTFVGAMIDRDVVVIGNVGDSRAYWIDDSGSADLLTVDDSMAQLHISMGVDRETAENGPQAHAITRWLGADSPGDPTEPTWFQPPGDGWLLLCSDGLWNYASEPQDLVTLVREAAHAGVHEPADLAARLTRWACDQGGRDNITVALARFGTRQDVSDMPAPGGDESMGTEPAETDAPGAARHTGTEAASTSDD